MSGQDSLIYDLYTVIKCVQLYTMHTCQASYSRKVQDAMLNLLTAVLVVGVALGLAADIVLEVLVVVADNVARRIILTDDVVAIGALGPPAADALGALPHELREVAGVAVEAGRVVVVLGAFVAPEVGPAVGGGPAAAPGNVLAMRVIGLHTNVSNFILSEGVCGG